MSRATLASRSLPTGNKMTTSCIYIWYTIITTEREKKLSVIFFHRNCIPLQRFFPPGTREVVSMFKQRHRVTSERFIDVDYKRFKEVLCVNWLDYYITRYNNQKGYKTLTNTPILLYNDTTHRKTSCIVIISKHFSSQHRIPFGANPITSITQ